jgi:glutamyl-tRNA synthetase
MPLEGDVVVHDELRGPIRFAAADLEDQVLLKSDSYPTYQLASVVDDHLMEITHVSRGDEWISSFPKNILLYQAFGWEPPKFIHFTLVLNKEGGKLSKRQGDVAVEDYRAKGYLPAALLNFCALLGWHPKGDNEIFLIEDIIKEFDYHDMGVNPAVFDTDKLDYFNGYYIRQLSPDKYYELALPYLEDLIVAGGKDEAYVKSVIALEQERLKKLSELPELTSLFFAREIEYDKDLLIWKNLTAEQVKTNLEKLKELLDKIPAGEWTHHSVKDSIMTYIEAKGLKTGDYLWPLRVSLTGRKASPSPFEVAEVLGKEESMRRVEGAIRKF